MAQHALCVPQASMVTDIRLMKQLDFNAVRASHYPNHTRWCVRRASVGLCGCSHPSLCSVCTGCNHPGILLSANTLLGHSTHRCTQGSTCTAESIPLPVMPARGVAC